MSWIPVFKIGFWNAWILALFIILHPLMMTIVDKAIGTGQISKKMGEEPGKEGQKQPIPLPTILLMILFTYSIFLPLKLRTPWLYLGLSIYFMGVLVFMSAIITAAKTPQGLVFSRGMYRYSRHPLYLSFLLIFLGISTASASWLFLLLSMGWMIFPVSQVTGEEKGCLELFGNEYQAYLKRTPKWLGIPKSK